MEKNLKKYTYIHVYAYTYFKMNLFVVHLKWTHCKSTILWGKKTKQKKYIFIGFFGQIMSRCCNLLCLLRRGNLKQFVMIQGRRVVTSRGQCGWGNAGADWISEKEIDTSGALATLSWFEWQLHWCTICENSSICMFKTEVFS